MNDITKKWKPILEFVSKNCPKLPEEKWNDLALIMDGMEDFFTNHLEVGDACICYIPMVRRKEEFVPWSIVEKEGMGKCLTFDGWDWELKEVTYYYPLDEYAMEEDAKFNSIYRNTVRGGFIEHK